jgi:glycosyltransferase involved in cell wall biosynthesis
VHILHVTPHLPPDQAANALLPWQLGNWAHEAGDTVEYGVHPPRAPGSAPIPGPVTRIPQRTRGPLERAFPLGSILGTVRIRRSLTPLIARADLVHVHSNGLLPEVAVLLARRRQKPVVLTLYGTEIWHYTRKRLRPDLFTSAYRTASAVTFYSEGLRARASELGLARHRMQVIYPPVSSDFAWHDEEARSRQRKSLGISSRHLLLNVKRLHPLAGQRFLIDAMREVIRIHPDTQLVICGTGPLADDLRAAAQSADIERNITFTGLVDNATVARYCAAADLFVLPSLLEALPTVAVEALASGTPVISSDNPGGVELNGLFGTDVTVVPREQPSALAAAISRFLDAKRRTDSNTIATVDRLFRPAAVAARYRELYRSVCAEGER